VARLRITGGDGPDQVVDVRAPRTQIGRGRDNDIVLTGAEHGVSRVHAELRIEDGRHIVVDLQSQNGTYVNGKRVDRGEVPAGGEIAIGSYRLRLLEAPAAAGASLRPSVDPLDEMRVTERHAPLRVPASTPAPAVQTPAQRWGLVAAGVVVLLGVGAAGAAWFASSHAVATNVNERSSLPVQEPAAGVERTASAPVLPEAAVAGPPPTESAAPRSASNPQPVVPKPRPAGSISRRPGESAEAWRAREAALHTRYGYSKAALERGDYAAATGGFEAVLHEEPGFLDAPRLLVQAQAGLRASARALFDAADRLDRAGDWVGALQKYEQAKQVHAGLPGVDGRIARTRQRVEAAGVAAFAQGQAHDAAGRVEEAIREYEKAMQWLPADDPNRQAARSRVEQLRKRD
jgi:tetratricopeptide (TPR) repeat protein